MRIETLGLGEFGRAVGGLIPGHENLVGDVLAKYDFSFRFPTNRERDLIIIEVLNRIRQDTQIVGSASRQDVWQTGWSENLSLFESSHNYRSLVPKFMRPSLSLRWQGKYVVPTDSLFEVNFAEALRAFACGVFLAYEVREIHEFGAGTGWNMVDFAQKIASVNRSPVEFFGSDFVPSAVELQAQLGGKFGLDLSTRLFDMRVPDPEYQMGQAGPAGVFTFGALEQLSGDFEPMVEFLLQKKPRVVISIEPDVDTYSEATLEDYLARWFQSRRGYSSGVIAYLRKLESEGRVAIERARRIGFGSLMMEGYNLMIWRPLD